MVFGPSTPWQLIMIQWGWWQVCQVCQCLSWKTYTCWKKQNLKSVKFLTSLSEPFNRNSVKISDCRACSLFETVPCCQTFSHSEFFFCVRLRIFSLFCRMYHPLADILFFTWKFYGDVNESPRIFAHFMLSIFLHMLTVCIDGKYRLLKNILFASFSFRRKLTRIVETLASN